MTQYLVRHGETGATAVVASLDGYGEPDWVAIGSVPPELDGCAVKEEDGAIVEDDNGLWLLLRKERDVRLTESDKYMLPDYPIDETTRAQWTSYRQALRDLPEVTANPASPEWPVPPA
jgi:hypothetical protein